MADEHEVEKMNDVVGRKAGIDGDPRGETSTKAKGRVPRKESDLATSPKLIPVHTGGRDIPLPPWAAAKPDHVGVTDARAPVAAAPVPLYAPPGRIPKKGPLVKGSSTKVGMGREPFPLPVFSMLPQGRTALKPTGPHTGFPPVLKHTSCVNTHFVHVADHSAFGLQSSTSSPGTSSSQQTSRTVHSISDSGDDYSIGQFSSDEGGNTDEEDDVSDDDELQRPDRAQLLAALTKGHEEAAADNVEGASVFDSFAERFKTETSGPAIDAKLASFLTGIWGRKAPMEKKEVKTLLAAHPRPENLQCVPIDLNDEVVASVRVPWARKRDVEMRTIHHGLVGCFRGLAVMMDTLGKGPKPDQAALNAGFDVAEMLAHTAALVNTGRRDAMRPLLHEKYHHKMKSSVAGTEPLLFGPKFGEAVKAANAVGPMASSSSRGEKRKGNFRGGDQKRRRFNRKGDESVSFLSCLVTENALPLPNPLPFPSVCREQEGQLDDELDQRGLQKEVDEPLVGTVVEALRALGPADHRAGGLARGVDEWAKLTSDRQILQDIRGHHIEFDEWPTQHKVPRPLNFSQTENDIIALEIERLLEKGVISEVAHEPGEFISNIFVREKKDSGKFRMILNIKELNKHVKKHHFKMDTLTTALSLIEQGDWFLSIDFTDAYYSVNIAAHHRKLLRFVFQDRLLQFNVFPNGLTSGPRTFTKVLKVPLSFLREVFGVTIVGYLDDTLLVERSAEKVASGGVHAVELFHALGFIISEKKSVLAPSQTIEYLGFCIDSNTMRVTLPEGKRKKLKEHIMSFLPKEQYTVQEVASLQGKLAATAPANPWALLYSKRLEQEKTVVLKQNGYRFDDTMTVSSWAKTDLQWWLSNLDHLFAPVRRAAPDFTVYTDASKLGWGYYLPAADRKGGGRWSEEEQQCHINEQELTAVLFTLQAEFRTVSEAHVKVMSDNTTTVACINKQGSVGSFRCDKIARVIWEFALPKNIWISAAHCPGVDNVEADHGSRHFKDETEWSLQKAIYQAICEKLEVEPVIDMFASRLNAQTQRFCSWRPDPEAAMVDAFSVQWSDELIYAFPPFSIIHKVLEKLRQDEATGLLLVPYWPTKPWFTQLTASLIATPVTFSLESDMLFIPGRPEPQPQHHMVGKTPLVAAVCSGRRALSKAFRRTWRKSWGTGDDSHPRAYTRDTLESGRRFSLNGAFVSSKPL